MADRNDPVGVFDSGVGGISTLGSLTVRLPDEHFIYFGDTANAPYGTKPPEEVLRCAANAVQGLLDRHVKAIVIACNTATSAAAAALREKLDLPVIGIEPALKPAAERRQGGAILVLATPVTLSLPKYKHLESLYGEGTVDVPCPGLMELVERKDFAGAKAYLGRKLRAFDPEKVDGIVLGCTHYVFLRPVLRELLPAHVRVFDGNDGTARQLRRVLAERGLLRTEKTGSVAFTTSGDAAAVVPVMRDLYAISLALAREAAAEC